MVTKPVKYTPQYVTELLNNMIAELENDSSIILINQLLTSQGLYKQIWYTWTKDFENNEEISVLIKKIETELESRLFLGGLDTTFNPTMAIFGLKNKYGWRDHKEGEGLNVNVNFINSLPRPTVNPSARLQAESEASGVSKQ